MRQLSRLPVITHVGAESPCAPHSWTSAVRDLAQKQLHVPPVADARRHLDAAGVVPLTLLRRAVRLPQSPRIWESVSPACVGGWSTTTSTPAARRDWPARSARNWSSAPRERDHSSWGPGSLSWPPANRRSCPPYGTQPPSASDLPLPCRLAISHLSPRSLTSPRRLGPAPLHETRGSLKRSMPSPPTY
jgi:hypothetical protein